MTEEQIIRETYSSDNNYGSKSNEHNFEDTVTDFLDNEVALKKLGINYLSDYMNQSEANIMGRNFGIGTATDSDGNVVSLHYGGNIDYGIDMIKGGAQKEMDYTLTSDIPNVDVDWAASKFLAPLATLAATHQQTAFQTWALSKTSDSSLGNSGVINPLPQFTRYADVRITTDPSKIGYDPSSKDSSGNLVYNAGADVSYGTVKFQTGLGMGRYYSEALEDYQQEVYMQFGVPEFNSMFSFLTTSVSYEDTYIANHGRYPIEFGMSSWVGARAMFAVYPFISLAIWALQAVYRTVVGFSPFSYYYLKPTMTGYWGTVNTIVSSMCVELGIYTMDPVGDTFGVDATDGDNTIKSKEMGIPVQFNQLEMMELKSLLPGLFGDNTCYVDMYKLASTHQIISSRVKNEWAKILEGRGSTVQDVLLGAFINTEGTSAFTGENIITEGANLRNSHRNGDFDAFGSARQWIGKTLSQNFNEFKQLLNWFWTGSDSISSSLFKNTTHGEWPFADDVTKAEVKNIAGFYGGDTKDAQSALEKDNKTAQDRNKSSNSGSSDSLSKIGNSNSSQVKDTTTSSNGIFKKVVGAVEDWYMSGASVLNAVNRDGGLFVGFRVNTTRSASESFSNSTAPIETGELIKSVSGVSRNARFSLSGGNMLPGMDDVINVAKNVVLGVLDGATFGLSSVVASALSGAFIDIPDRWESSSSNISNVTYTVRLVSPYGNPISQLQNIYIPLACLLAGVLPLQTGRSSHTSPYICNLFCKGVQNIELGIITELSIERGTSNLPFSKWKQPLAIDVSFTVADLSGVISAPIDRGIFQALLAKGPIETLGTLTTESRLDDYIGTLCARDVSNSRFIMPSFQRRMKKALLRTGQIFNTNRLEFFIGEVTNPIAAIFGAPPWAAQSASKNANRVGTDFNPSNL